MEPQPKIDFSFLVRFYVLVQNREEQKYSEQTSCFDLSNAARRSELRCNARIFLPYFNKSVASYCVPVTLLLAQIDIESGVTKRLWVWELSLLLKSAHIVYNISSETFSWPGWPRIMLSEQRRQRPDYCTHKGVINLTSMNVYFKKRSYFLLEHLVARCDTPVVRFCHRRTEGPTTWHWDTHI